MHWKISPKQNPDGSTTCQFLNVNKNEVYECTYSREKVIFNGEILPKDKLPFLFDRSIFKSDSSTTNRGTTFLDTSSSNSNFLHTKHEQDSSPKEETAEIIEKIFSNNQDIPIAIVFATRQFFEIADEQKRKGIPPYIPPIEIKKTREGGDQYVIVSKASSSSSSKELTWSSNGLGFTQPKASSSASTNPKNWNEHFAHYYSSESKSKLEKMGIIIASFIKSSFLFLYSSDYLSEIVSGLCLSKKYLPSIYSRWHRFVQGGSQIQPPVLNNNTPERNAIAFWNSITKKITDNAVTHHTTTLLTLICYSSLLHVVYSYRMPILETASILGESISKVWDFVVTNYQSLRKTSEIPSTIEKVTTNTEEKKIEEEKNNYLLYLYLAAPIAIGGLYYLSNSNSKTNDPKQKKIEN